MNDNKKKILVVEDSDTQALKLKWMLKQNGYDVEVAKNGAEGLEKAREFMPDLIISDIIMPIMDGFRMCMEIKENDLLKDIPVMLLTRMNEPEDILKGLEVGANNYITRPFNDDYFISKIRNLIDNPFQFKNRPEKKCIEVSYGNKIYAVGTGHAQTLDFLLSTYENLIWQNNELKEMNALTESLEAQIGMRTNELEKINELLSLEIEEHMLAKKRLGKITSDLEKSNKELEQFAYLASHDLQEPLRSISSFLRLMERRYRGKLDAKADEFITYTIKSADKMQHMIRDLLAFSRIDTFGKGFGPVDCESVIKGCLENLQMSIDENNASITYDSPPSSINADRTLLAQVFQNLISNAIKFRGDEFPRIHISVLDDNNEWVFAVKDNGIGLDMKNKNKLFSVFGRLHGGEFPGSGIGLAACKRIVERHGGRIWVESEVGKGSVFYFSIPKR